MTSTQSLRIVVSGLIAQHPRLGGMTWHYLNYVLGLSHLGHDVYYFEDSGLVPYDVSGRMELDADLAGNRDVNIRYLVETFGRFGMMDRWAYRCAPELDWFGLSDARRTDVLKSADLLINVSGSLDEPEGYLHIPRLVYIDTDPVVTQIKYLIADPPEFPGRVDAHDVHFSFGELGSQMPQTGHRWLPTRQPVFLLEWQPAESSRRVYTTVMSWASYAPLRWQGREYAQKDAEFQRYIELPSKVAPTKLEVAMAPRQHMLWQTKLEDLPAGARALVGKRPHLKPQELLEQTGWRVVNANERCGSIDDYRDYIRSSLGEWSVAKNAYVSGRPGWFSERSACYLAAGRPVIVQDTGFSEVLPVGEGLFAFATLDEAATALQEAGRRYGQHSRSALALAEAYFDSGKVLSDLIERALSAGPDRQELG
jgi:hypothetical protein